MSGRTGAALEGPDRGPLDTPLSQEAGIRVPLICGAMYPCSNPELVAAVSEAGGIGIVQPVSLTYVHGWDFREGLRYIRSLTTAPIGFNALIESSSTRYRRRIDAWLEIALEEGVRFVVTSLGKPDDVVERVHAAGGVVYHDVTERRWALKGRDGGVDGLIAVNSNAGGHAGPRAPRELLDEVGDLGLPVVCAGGVATPDDFAEALRMGYAGVQCGTRFIATEECTAGDRYKEAILEAGAEDIVLTERLTGVPVSVIETPFVKALGTKVGPIVRRLLKWPKTRHWVRAFFTYRSMRRLRRSAGASEVGEEYWQAGRSVQGIHTTLPAARIVQRFEATVRGSTPHP